MESAGLAEVDGAGGGAAVEGKSGLYTKSMNEQAPASDLVAMASLGEQIPVGDVQGNTIATLPSKRVCIMVLGMHRSGTSSLAGTLVKLGAAAPRTLLGSAESNAMGHWESQPLFLFNDELLFSAGSRWDDWRSFNQAWYDTPLAARFKERAFALFAQEFGDAPLFVFKDPRNCRLTRFWLEILAEQEISAQIVLPIRSPLEVAQSHRARDGFSLQKGLLLWLRHVLDAEAASRHHARLIVEWDVFLSDPRGAVAAMESVFGAFPANTDLTVAELEKFLRRDLQHQRVSQDDLSQNPQVHEWVKQAYASLRELAHDPGSHSARVCLNKIKQQFDEASRLFGSALAELEVSLREAGEHIHNVSQAHHDVLAQFNRLVEERNAQTLQQEAWNGEREILSAEIARINAFHAESETRVHALEAESGARKLENGDLRDQIGKLQAQLSDAGTRRIELSESLEGYKEQIERINRTLPRRIVLALGNVRIFRRR